MLENEVATDEVLSNESEEQATDRRMEETIRDTLRGLQEQTAVTDDETEAPLDDVEKANKIRDEKGKFAAKEEAEPVAELEVAVEPELPVSNAPNTWKKEAKEEWIKLSPNVRAEVERREADFHKGIEQYKNKAQFADSVDRSIAPYMATINQLNVTPEVAITELLKIDHALRHGSSQQQVETLAGIFNNSNINIHDVFNYMQNGAPQADPRDQRLAALEQTIENQNRMAKESESNSLNSEINAFASNPSNSHFESVKGFMAALLQADQAKDLQDAYDQAIYANPTTRALVIAEQQTKAKSEATQKAQSAKASASVNVTRRPALATTAPLGTMDDTIKTTLRRLQGS